MQTDYEFDAFISYSHRDEEWVRQLVDRIEDAGLKAFLDYRDFTPGAPTIHEIERGVFKCRKTLVVLTPEYLQSEWCKVENIMLQALSPANSDLRLIPILKADCQKPLRLQILTHIDFTENANHNLAWRQLLTALGKPPEPQQPKEQKRDLWFLPHPYPMPPNFTGRLVERLMLSQWLDHDPTYPLLVLRALGGFGKSALTWHWLMHDVSPQVWPHVVWWSFYEGDASFDNFVSRTVNYLSGGQNRPDKISSYDVGTLVDMLHQPGTLLVLDGFERLLRAFGGLDAAYRGDAPDNSRYTDRHCVSTLASDFLRHVALQPDLRGKVLITTRLNPEAIHAKGGGFLIGCREKELKELHPRDATEFFLVQGIRGTDNEIQAACAPYGYHPLSLRLLAGLILTDFEHPGDIVAAKDLDVSGDLIQHQNHVLKVAYDRLTPTQQRLLGTIACFRSPVKYEVLKFLTNSRGEPSASLDADLRDLVARGLLHHDVRNKRFDLHPIVRRYAYDRLARPDRDTAHKELRDFFAALAPPDTVASLEDLAPVIELYHHTLRSNQYKEAVELFAERLAHPLFYLFGAHNLIIDLLTAFLPTGDSAAAGIANHLRGWLLNTLASSYSLSGHPLQALPLYQQSQKTFEKSGDTLNLGITLLASASVSLMPTGSLRSADSNLRRSIVVLKGVDKDVRASAEADLGLLLAYRGIYSDADDALKRLLNNAEKFGYEHLKSLIWSYRAFVQLLRQRHARIATIYKTSHSAVLPARRALEEVAAAREPNPRDRVQAHWLLGAAQLVNGQVEEAEANLHKAIEYCRRINNVDLEADILIDLARLRTTKGEQDEAQRLLEEALMITERSGYVLQGADANLELAKLFLSKGDKAAALESAKAARVLATCDGPPDYTYKAAYIEAEALLTHLVDEGLDVVL